MSSALLHTQSARVVAWKLIENSTFPVIASAAPESRRLIEHFPTEPSGLTQGTARRTMHAMKMKVSSPVAHGHGVTQIINADTTRENGETISLCDTKGKATRFHGSAMR